MKERLPAFILVVSVAIAISAATSVAAAQAVSDNGYTAPRTAWGHPDLQGNWTNSTLTPLERPAGLGPVYTPQQVAEIERAAEARLVASTLPSDPNREAPPVGGDGSTGAAGMVGGYDGVYIDRGEGVAIVNGEPRTSLVTFPENGRVPSTRPEVAEWRAEQAAARRGMGQYDHPELRPLGERCVISFGSNAGPPMLPNGFYNNNYTIVQNEDHVLIMAEMVHDARVIRLGDGPRLSSEVRPYFGDSWGRWEGETLVVETTNFHPNQRFRSNPSDNLKVIERFTRVDEETILYEFTIDDPAVYTEVWGGQVPMRRFDDRVYEYACHEGNYAMYNILSGARFQERMAAQEDGDSQ
jgi:hypothetical protein